VTLKGDTIARTERIIADYVRSTYGGEPATSHLRPRKSIAIKAAK
jgi:hypothetical protein